MGWGREHTLSLFQCLIHIPVNGYRTNKISLAPVFDGNGPGVFAVFGIHYRGCALFPEMPVCPENDIGKTAKENNL